MSRARSAGLDVPLAVAGPRSQTGGIPDHVRDVVLLVHAVEEVRHGPVGVDGHVLAGMALAISWDGGRLEKLRILYKTRYRSVRDMK